MASTLTTFDAFLKEEYADASAVDRLVYKDHPCLDMYSKKDNDGGDQFVHPVLIGNPQGLGPTRTIAQSGSTQAFAGANTRGKKWVVPWGTYAASVEIGDQVIDASKQNFGAFLRNEKEEIDGLYRAFGDTMGYYIFADSGRHLAVGTESTGVITCSAGTETDIANIEVGQRLVASANDGTSSGHTLLGSGSLGYVFAVNKNAGTFTVATSAANAAAGTAGTPGSWTGTMYFFREGDFGPTGNTIFHGLGAWIPSSDPTSTSFNGVDRTEDITKLSGVRLTSGETSGLGLEQRLKKLVTKMAGRGGVGMPSHIFVNPEKWQQLADSLESRGTRPLDGGTGKFGYKKLELVAGGGMVQVYADRFCPVGTAFALDMSVCKLHSLSGFPKILNGDGLRMLRKSDSDNYEFRLVTYPGHVVASPGKCGRVAV